MKYFIVVLLGFLSCNPPLPPTNLCEIDAHTQDEYTVSEDMPNVYPKTLRAFNDFEAGIACAQRQNKPIFLIFVGYGLRVHFFPDIVLQDPTILTYLEHDFVPQ